MADGILKGADSKTGIENWKIFGGAHLEYVKIRLVIEGFVILAITRSLYNECRR